ncbi:MAG: hypothetical protein KDA28_17340 [Phycisphaerales bacterium]|nr:hypothetical protein [Phycisphaerales bacterium]
MRHVATLLLAALGAGCASTHVQDHRVNLFTTSAQEGGSVAREGDLTMIAWESRRQHDGRSGVYARRLDPSGVTGEIDLHPDATGLASDVAIDVRNGILWATWTETRLDGSGTGIALRRFDRDLRPLGETTVANVSTAGDQTDPVIATDDLGATVVWVSNLEIHARRFDRDGSPLSVEDEILGRGYAPTVERSDGHETIAFTTLEGDVIGCIDGVMTTLATGQVMEPSLAPIPGGFVATWIRASEAGPSVEAGAYDLDGTRRWSRTVAAADGVHRSAATVTTNAHHILVAFNREGDLADDADVLGIRYDLEGSIVEAAHVLTDRTEGPQRLAIGSRGIALDDDGQVLTAWSGDAGQEDGTGMHLTSASGVVSRLAVQSLGAFVAEPHIPPTFDPNVVREPWVQDRERSGPDFGFQAINNTGWTPPDPEMAVGMNHVVVMTNGEIAFFDKSGTNLFRDQIEGGGGFWGTLGAGGFVFDPECHYDAHHDRFWAMACERTGGRSYYLVAVSDDGNPVGTWYRYRLDVTALAGGDIDSPNMAILPGEVYLTADFFSPDKYLVYVLDKGPLLSGGSVNDASLLVTGDQSMGLAMHYDASAPRQYIIESTEFSTNTTVRLHAINNPLGSPSLSTLTLTVPSYQYPVPPNSRGTSSRPTLFEPRFWSCMYVNGSLWAVHHITRVGESRDIVRWYEFDMAGWPTSGSTPTLLQWGEIDAGGSTHCYFPSIAADASGNAAITFARSSTSEYISMWRALRRGDDALGTFGPQTIVKESTAPYTSTRWGDYSATQSDPAVPCTFWGHHEYTPNGSWSTWVGSYGNGDAADLNGDCVLDIFDLLRFLDLFEQQDPMADWNGDTIFDVFDVLAYVASFG